MGNTWIVLGVSLAVGGCGGGGGADEPSTFPAADDAGDEGGGLSVADDGGGLVGDLDGGTDGDGLECAKTTVAAVTPPIDVILSVDQSGSMSDDIANVKANINKLATFLNGTKLDYRVVMIASYGAPYHSSSYSKAYEVCVPAPLGNAKCGAPNPPLFRQVNRNVQSLDTLKIILTTYDETTGDKEWASTLRKDALKVFVPITDDDSRQYTTTTCKDADYEDATKYACNPNAAIFDELLLAKPGGQFGSAARRNYAVYPIVGAAAYPSEKTCGTNAVNNGKQYLDLAKLTKGKWFPICLKDFGPVFTEIAKNVAARVACELKIPDPPAGEKIDHDKVNVTWTPTSGGGANKIPQDTSKPCDGGANGWQYDAEKTKVLLCGDACAKVQADPGSKVDLELGCKTEVK